MNSVERESRSVHYNKDIQQIIDRLNLENNSMPNQTMTRFGYPHTLVREYNHWVVLLREQQVTLGSLVLCSKSDETAFSKLSADSFTEMNAVIGDIERALGEEFQYDKINYLMFMMIDPNVHFHVIPRYASEKCVAGLSIADQGWPGAPKLSVFKELTSSERDIMCARLKDIW